jgi:hypothetical protein
MMTLNQRHPDGHPIRISGPGDLGRFVRASVTVTVRPTVAFPSRLRLAAVARALGIDNRHYR